MSDEPQPAWVVNETFKTMGELSARVRSAFQKMMELSDEEMKIWEDGPSNPKWEETFRGFIKS